MPMLFHDRLMYHFTTCLWHGDLLMILQIGPMCGGSRGQQREGAVRAPYMGTPPTLRCYWLWALCSCLSTRWPSSSCRLTLIILVSPRTYRKSWCRFKIDSGRAAVRSPNKAQGHPDCVWTTDRHTRLEYQPASRQGWKQKVACG